MSAANSLTTKTDETLAAENFLYATLSSMWSMYNGPIQYKLVHSTDLAMSEIASLDNCLTQFYSYLNGTAPTADQLTTMRNQVIARAPDILKLNIIPS